MKKRATVTEKMFKAAKILFNSGSTTYEVAEYLDISQTTAYRMMKAETFEEYQNEQAAKGKARYHQMKAVHAIKEEQEKEEEPQEKKPVQNPMTNNYQMNRLIEIIKEQNEILKTMSNKIAFIVDELTK